MVTEMFLVPNKGGGVCNIILEKKKIPPSPPPSHAFLDN
jgi:hypothetical protein